MGKKIKFAFTIPAFLFEHYYTHRTLTYNKEYEIDNTVVSNFNFAHIDSLYFKYLRMFDTIICGSKQLSILKDFYDFIRYNELYHDRRITSGIYMCAFAVALGYKEIYIAGIDLYSSKEAYAFDTMQKNLLMIAPDFSTTPSSCHAKEIDIEALYFLEKHYEVKFYSICPNSPINEYIPLAPKQNNATFQVEKKKDSIRDMLTPSVAAYEKLNYGIEFELQHSPLDRNKEKRREIQRYKQTLRDNSIYKIYRDIIRLPKAIYRYIKGCRLSKRLKENTR